MCGRFGLSNPERLDGFLFRHALPVIGAVAPRFNITPSADIPIVLSMKGDLMTTAARWGLVPSWATDPSIGTKLVQARGETAHEKPAFRGALKSKRALIPADLFYEWQAIEGQKMQQPWCIRMKGEEPFAMAALWEMWLSPDAKNGEPMLSCCVLTTSANHALKTHSPSHAGHTASGPVRSMARSEIETGSRARFHSAVSTGRFVRLRDLHVGKQPGA